MYKVYLKVKVFKGCKRHGFGGVGHNSWSTQPFKSARFCRSFIYPSRVFKGMRMAGRMEEM
jgi:ribosomal protein L3